MQSFIMNSHEVFFHIHQGCFAGTGAIVRLPQCQWSKPDWYGKISQCITTTKHSKAKTVCIFLGIYCMSIDDEHTHTHIYIFFGKTLTGYMHFKRNVSHLMMSAIKINAAIRNTYCLIINHRRTATVEIWLRHRAIWSRIMYGNWRRLPRSQINGQYLFV